MTLDKQIGRPSKYDRTRCKAVIDLGKQGRSFVEIACELGIARSTLDTWASQHPEFSEALTRAREEAQAWWERQGREGLTKRGFNGHLWIKTMQARFRQDYTERRELDVTENRETKPIDGITDEKRARALAHILQRAAPEADRSNKSITAQEPPVSSLVPGSMVREGNG